MCNNAYIKAVYLLVLLSPDIYGTFMEVLTEQPLCKATFFTVKLNSS